METIAKPRARPSMTTDPETPRHEEAIRDSDPGSIKIFEVLKGELSAEIIDYVSGLELDIDIGAVQERLEKTTLSFSEPLTPTSKKIQENGALATYYAPYRSAVVPIPDSEREKEGFPDQNLIHSAVHELFHAASGQIFVVRQTEAKQEPDPQVVGLSREGKFKWLNEAVTEELTRTLLRNKGLTDHEIDKHSTYSAERKVFAEILSVSGISTEAFLEAYFEEPDLEAPYGKRMPKWRNLQAALSQKFGPHALRKIIDHVKDDESLSVLLEKDKNGETFISRLHGLWEQKQKRQRRIVKFVGMVGLKSLAGDISKKQKTRNAHYMPDWLVEYKKQQEKERGDWEKKMGLTKKWWQR